MSAVRLRNNRTASGSEGRLEVQIGGQVRGAALPMPPQVIWEPMLWEDLLTGKVELQGDSGQALPCSAPESLRLLLVPPRAPHHCAEGTASKLAVALQAPWASAALLVCSCLPLASTMQPLPLLHPLVCSGARCAVMMRCSMQALRQRHVPNWGTMARPTS